jgi:hypothetical protein
VTLQAPSPTCELSGTAPTVSVPSNKTMESAINAVLAPLADLVHHAPTGWSTCDDGLAFQDQAFEVTANGNGLLSIRVKVDAMMTGGAHPNAGIATYNFDLTNGGKVLNFLDVADGDGTLKIIAACIAAGRAQEKQNNPDPGNPSGEGGIAEELCQDATVVTSVPADGDTPAVTLQPQWVATATGLELVSGTDHADGDFITSTTAWKDLIASGLNPGVVLTFAESQK